MPKTTQVSPRWRSVAAVLTCLVASTLASLVTHPHAGATEPEGSKGSSPEASQGGSPTRETPTVLAIRRASPAVVNIHGQKTVRNTAAGFAGAGGPDSFRQVNGMGTGVVIDPRGYVITNYHVVEDVSEIRVTLDDGETTTADLIATRPRNDLALVKVRATDRLPTIPRGTSSDLMIGESVIAIGNAFGYVHTSTQGIISALHRDVPVNETQSYEDLIQISAGINPGNSGGPLLNIDGEMIGMNVAVRVGAQQIAFAIPVDQVIDTVAAMIEEHNEKRLTMGLRTDGSGRGRGVTVAHVSTSSPAAAEGLQAGDRVVRVGSQSVADRLDYALAMLDVAPGEPLELEIDRDGQRVEVAMRAYASRQTAAPSDPAWDVLGIRVRRLDDAAMRRINGRMRTRYNGGLSITSVRPGSPAARQGVQPGDVLLGIHEWQTVSVQDLAGILNHPDVKQGPRARFYIVRRDEMLYGHFQLADQAPASRR